MKFTINDFTDDEDYRTFIDIEVRRANGETLHLSFYDGEPEDNSINRNFSHVYSIQRAVEAAHAAGAAGEPLEIVKTEEDPF